MCAQRSPQGGRGNPLRVGIIGCGTIGAVHAEAAAASDQIELVAVADVQRELAEKTAAAHTVETVYSSGAALLADARVEAVVLALPACFRIELGIQALRAGKHLLTEKPVARSADEVRRLISVQGDRVAACCSSRFQFLESTRTVTDWIGQGKLGALRLLRCRAISPAGPAPETPAPAWRLSRELNGGGILVNWGCYDLDYLLGISGWRLRPQTVLAQSWRVPSTFADTVAPASDAETHITGLVRCADGIALTYERGEYTAAQAEASWEVIGEAGSLRLWMTPAQEKKILQFEGNRAEGTIPRTLGGQRMGGQRILQRHPPRPAGGLRDSGSYGLSPQDDAGAGAAGATDHRCAVPVGGKGGGGRDICGLMRSRSKWITREKE